MARRFAIQHKTSKRYLALWPSLGHGHQETDHEADAASHGTKEKAESERVGIADFADAWEIVPVEVEMQGDTVSVAVRERKRRDAGEFRA